MFQDFLINTQLPPNQQPGFSAGTNQELKKKYLLKALLPRMETLEAYKASLYSPSSF